MELLFAQDGQSLVLEKLIVDQRMHLVLLRETPGYAITVHPRPLGKVAGYADRQGVVALASQNINGRSLAGDRKGND